MFWVARTTCCPGARSAQVELDDREAREATAEELERVHPAGYLAALDEVEQPGGWLDPDTWIGPGSLRAARLAAGAGCEAVLEVIEKEKTQENCLKLGNYILAGLNKLKGKYQVIGDVRGKGLMIGVEFVKDRGSRVPDGETAEAVATRAIAASARSRSGWIERPSAAVPKTTSGST